MWAPTTVITPSGTYEYPLKERKYNYPNGSAFQYEATAVRNYLKSGRFAIPASGGLISLFAFRCLILTHLSFETPKGKLANNAEPDQTQQNALPNLGIHCLQIV